VIVLDMNPSLRLTWRLLRRRKNVTTLFGRPSTDKERIAANESAFFRRERDDGSDRITASAPAPATQAPQTQAEDQNKRRKAASVVRRRYATSAVRLVSRNGGTGIGAGWRGGRTRRLKRSHA
jgi:hypothetical protein